MQRKASPPSTVNALPARAMAAEMVTPTEEGLGMWVMDGKG